MKTIMTIAAAAAFTVLSTGSSLAQCADDQSAGISKDGTTAPLEDGVDNSATTGSTSGDGVTKDGSSAPLETDEDIAMSDDDVQAQQQGEDTDMAEADAMEEDCVEPS
ncbi:hypothetical protein [Pararhizobium haloflavum]|uniref:hypothetical protein n=1 Tax=Pararhizobium haloflavum TaxID=2037914 RepID=UPI000C17D6AE|nr:hypothetical protein [Pararhizobium haloflavum]